MTKRIPVAALAVAVAAAWGSAHAQTGSSYVTDTRGGAVHNSFGQCWRSMGGTLALEQCEPRPVAAAAPAPAPEPVREPEPVAQAAPPPAPVPIPVIAKVTLQSEVLFDFGRSTLRDEGRRKLDELADQVKGAQVQEIIAVGHADRIDSERYNKDLSERRAAAVRDYLVEKGFEQKVVRAEGKGEQEPVTGEQCAKLGPARASNTKLVSCLRADRRVEIEVLGTREEISQR